MKALLWRNLLLCVAMNKALKDMLSAHGKMAINIDTRHLCITDTDEQIAMFDKAIEEMDREIPQILVEAKSYDVSCSAYLDFGFNWFAGTATVFDAATGVPIAGKTDPYVASIFGSAISPTPYGTASLRLGVLNDNVNIDGVFRAVQDNIKTRLLGDIPLLGELFKFRGNKTVNSELIVFITPRIISPPELSEGDSRKLDLMESELTEPDGPPPTTECSQKEQ